MSNPPPRSNSANSNLDADIGRAYAAQRPTDADEPQPADDGSRFTYPWVRGPGGRLANS